MVGVEHAKFYTRFCMVLKAKGSTLKILKTRPFTGDSLELNILRWAFVKKTSGEFLQSELLEAYLDN